MDSINQPDKQSRQPDISSHPPDMLSHQPDEEELRDMEAAVESILFASGEPVHIDRFCTALSVERPDAERILHRLRDYYAYERRGMRLLQLEDNWQLCSSPDHADVIRKAFEIRKPAKLSQPALEALTIIAYYQPTTRAYVDKLRGVDSSYTVRLLEERGLIEECGRLQAPGRPVLYRTTEQFLRAFHLSTLEELPPLPEGGGLGAMPPGITVPPTETAAPDQPTPQESATPETSAVPPTPQESTTPETSAVLPTSQESTTPETESVIPSESESVIPDETDAEESDGIPEGPPLWYPREIMPPQNIKRRRPDPKKVKRRKERARRKHSTVRKRRFQIGPRRRVKTESAEKIADGAFDCTDHSVSASDCPEHDTDSGGNSVDSGINSADSGVNNTDSGVNSADSGGNHTDRHRHAWRSAGRWMRCLLYGCWVSWPFWWH